LKAVVDPQLRHAGPNGLDVTRIAADEALDPGQNLRPAFQITQTCKPSDEPRCLAALNHPTTVAFWLRPDNAVLPAPIKEVTSFEHCNEQRPKAIGSIAGLDCSFLGRTEANSIA
jgi:hypothetical protein